MRNESHKTLIGIIREHLTAWRKQEGWSRESLADQLVLAHVACGGQIVTGIDFSAEKDTFARMKVNADRIFRWLDDETKDCTLLPSNFIPSALAAMPLDRRIRCADEIMAYVGLSVVDRTAPAAGPLDAKSHLLAHIKEGSEAQSALARLPENPTLDQLIAARNEVADERNTADATLRHLDADIAAKRATSPLKVA